MMELYDQDGFLKLIRKTKPEPAEKPKDKPKDKEKKNPFKKGSWKHAMLKALLKWKSPKSIEDFHFTKMENLLVSTDDKKRYKRFSTRLTKEKLDQFSVKHKKAMVLINAGDGVYLQITLKCYLALMDIKRLKVSIDLKGQEDAAGESEWFDIFTDELVIDSINELMSFINYYRKLVDGIMTVQAHCCWYTYVKYKIHTVVLKQDGTAEAYKGDFNDFLNAYHFTPLL